MTGPGGTSACPATLLSPLSGGCVSRTNAIELLARNVQIGVNQYNTISNYFFEGVSVSNPKNVTISNNSFYNNGWSQYQPYGAVHVFNNYAPVGTGPTDHRQGSSVTISSNTISNTVSGTAFSYGITLIGGALPTTTGISISGNSVTSGAHGGHQCWGADYTISSGIVSGATSDHPWVKCP
jgi:hypothetical protein